MPDSPDTSWIAVVSGLPRSGTSLLMQMLAAGGVEPLTDARRTADDDNPRGYFELESVKQIDRDASFLDAAHGKAVKLIHALAVKLPVHPGREYRVVFMDRPIEEVIESQARMLARNGKAGAKLPPDRLRAIFEKQRHDALQVLANRGDVRLLTLDYPAVVADPEGAARQLDAFLGPGLDVRSMVEAVDPSLHRNRAGG